MLKSTNIPLYSQISEDLHFKIMSGEWKNGEKILTEMELCKAYGVSRITIRKAIDDLVREGYLHRERAKGTFVQFINESESEHSTMVRTFNDEMKEIGKTAITLKADVELIKANKLIAKQLMINEGDKVLRLSRIRGTDGKAFAYFLNYISYTEAFSLKSKDYYNSFYEYLSTFGIIMSGFKEYLEATIATPELQRLLKIDKNRPILKRVRWASQANKDFHEYSECYYIGDQYRYYIDMGK